jgi:hypothetical protein
LVAAGAVAFASPAAASTVVGAEHGNVVIPASWGDKAPVIDVTMTNAGFSLPDSVHAGFVTFRVGTPDPTYHALQGLSLKAGHTIDEVIADFQLGLSNDRAENALGSRNLLVHANLIGGVVTDAYAPLSVTVPLEAGTYYFFDQLEIGEPGTAPPRLHTLSVHGNMKWNGLPEFSSIIGLTGQGETMFEAPSSFDANGSTLIYNNADQVHEAVWRPAQPGTTDAYIDDYYYRINNGLPRLPSPYAGPTRGLAAMTPGRFAVLQMDMAPGLYVLVCAVPDTTTGIAHTRNGGMYKVVTLY